DLSADLAQSRRRGPHGRRTGRDVSRPTRRAGRRASDHRDAAASLYAPAAPHGSRSGKRRPAPHAPRRRGAEPARSAGRLRLPPALPSCQCALQGGTPGPAQGGQGLGRLPRGRRRAPAGIAGNRRYARRTRMRKTIVGCRALLGEGALPSRGAAEPEGDLVPAQGLLVTAGLINGHHHSHEGFYKGRKDNLPLELWMNYVRPLRPIELTPRDVYLRTMIGAIEAVKSGTTTISDDFNQSPRLRPDHVEQVFQAYTDIGIRANVGITLFDRPFFRAVPFVEEEFPRDLLARLDASKMYSADELLAFVTNLARTKHPKENRVGYIAAPSAPQRCTEEFLLKVRRMADDHDLPLMIHVQERRMQVVTGQLWYGSTMIEYLDRIGFMKPKTAFIHGVWLNPREIEILARTGVSIQHTPTSNLKVGSGLAPIRALLDAGVNVSMCTDGCGSIEGTAMPNSPYPAALLQKARGDQTTTLAAPEAFYAATMGGAKALGRAKELGAVEAGRI